MAKVLKITKQDKTTHVSPLSNKAFLEAFNKRQPGEKRWKIEEIDEAEAEKLPFMDESYVTAGEAQKKLEVLAKESEDKDKEIARLKSLLEGNAGSGTSSEKKTAEEVIALINAATKKEDIEKLIEGDTRKTVNDAAKKKIESLSAE